MNKSLLYIGMDVHAQTIAIALAESGGGEVRNFGSIANDLKRLDEKAGVARRRRGLNLSLYENEKPDITDGPGLEGHWR